jgi:hypothetical protein
MRRLHLRQINCFAGIQGKLMETGLGRKKPFYNALQPVPAVAMTDVR